METLLVHQQIAWVLPPLVKKFATAQVELRGCERAVALSGVGPATEQIGRRNIWRRFCR